MVSRNSKNAFDEQRESRRSVREKHFTEKGAEYACCLRLQAANSAKRAWRKQINVIHSILATRKDVATLTAGCEELNIRMTQFCEAHEAVEAIVEDEEERRLLDTDSRK